MGRKEKEDEKNPEETSDQHKTMVIILIKNVERWYLLRYFHFAMFLCWYQVENIISIKSNLKCRYEIGLLSIGAFRG